MESISRWRFEWGFLSPATGMSVGKDLHWTLTHRAARGLERLPLSTRQQLKKLTQVRGAATVSWNIFIPWNDSTAKVSGISFRMNKVVLHLQGKELPAFRIWEERVLSRGTWSLASTKVLNGLVVRLTSIIFWCLKKSVKICTTQWAYIFQRPRAYVSKLHIVHDLFEEIQKKVFVSRNASVCKDAVYPREHERQLSLQIRSSFRRHHVAIKEASWANIMRQWDQQMLT